MSFNTIRVEVIKILIDFNEKIFFERKMKQFYKKKGLVEVVIDVGANKGQSIDFFLAINPECVIYSIEPNPELFELLKNKYAKNNNVKLFNFGISDKSGEKLFFENVLDYSSTFEELNMASEYLQKKANTLGVLKENIVKKSYPVNTVTLSEFIRNNVTSEIIDVLKIDTEGHEYYCLVGLFTDHVLPKIHYIQLENHNDDMYANRIEFHKINDLLNKNCFTECVKIEHGIGDFHEIVFTSL